LQWRLKQGQKRNEALDCLVYALIAREYAVSKLGTAQPYKKLRMHKAETREEVQLPLINKEETKQLPVQEPKRKSSAIRQPRKGNNWFGK